MIQSDPVQKVRFESFGYRYPALFAGDEPAMALDGISFMVEAGGFLGITGTTGSGKSTVCLAMNGLVPHSTGGFVRGDVFIDAINTKQSSVPQLARHVGLVFQDPESNLVGLNVEDEIAFGPENLGVPPDEISQRITWALQVVGMSAFRTRASAHLSGGQKQRVAIAAVLAMQPEVLVLDEPTAQLDPVGKLDVARAITALREQRGRSLTVIMVEQDAELLSRFAETMLVLDQGKIIASGTPAAVFGQNDELLRRGITCPQLVEVAGHLNRTLGLSLDFTTREDARRNLKNLIGDQRV